MSDIVDALGIATEGGLLARAVEPRAGEDAGHTHETECLNCGTPLTGPHCHQCGQRGHVHRTLGAFLHDLLHGVLHFEGKTWRTLPMLAWRPGELTRRYVAGERARFVSPMALFLFAVFVMFAVFQMVGIGPPDNLGPPIQIGSGSLAQSQRQEQLDALRDAREALKADNPAAPVIDGQIAALEKRIAAGAEDDANASDNDADLERLTRGKTGWEFLDHGIDKWRQNPGLMAYKLQANSYKFSWLLIPLSIPFVWLIFAWRRRFGPYDHAVFVTYSLCFMTLLFVVLALLGQVPGVSAGLLFLAAMVIPPLHIYKQLRGAYSLSRFSALWRMTVLMLFITIILLLFVNVLLLLGAMG